MNVTTRTSIVAQLISEHGLVGIKLYKNRLYNSYEVLCNYIYKCMKRDGYYFLTDELVFSIDRIGRATIRYASSEQTNNHIGKADGFVIAANSRGILNRIRLEDIKECAVLISNSIASHSQTIKLIEENASLNMLNLFKMRRVGNEVTIKPNRNLIKNIKEKDSEFTL